MITFNPGPSQLSEETQEDIRQAILENVLSLSHRSSLFTEMSQRAVLGLRIFFSIPDDYAVFYTSSATEAMELCIRNGVERTSFHFINGNFSEQFRIISELLYKNVHFDNVEWGSQNHYQSCDIPDDVELVTVTYNETSTGVSCSNDDIIFLRKQYPETLLAVDITSIAGIKNFRIHDADIWFFSVQKCFGLPAGLGIMIVSPMAIQKAQKLSDSGINTSCLFSYRNMMAKMDPKYQTVCTPNILGIYLLGKQLERWNLHGGVSRLESEAEKKAKIVYDFLREKKGGFSLYPRNESYASTSVFCISASEALISLLRKKCLENGMLIGSGYGPLKSSTFRIANFPAVSEDYIASLQKIMLEIL